MLLITRALDTIFIGVGTPERAEGSADLSYIVTVARQISESVEYCTRILLDPIFTHIITILKF